MADDTWSKRFTSLIAHPAIEEASLVKLFRRFSIIKQDAVKVQEREAVINGVRIRCLDTEAIDVAGRLGTQSSGRTTLRLSDFICRGGNQRFEEPASFVATPHSDSPVFLTTKLTLPDPPDDVIIEVSSWDADGSPAPNVAFSWRIWVITFFVVE